MPYLLSNLADLWPWLILMAALGSGWAGFARSAFALLAVWACIAVYVGILSITALIATALGLALAAWLRDASGLLAIVGWTALMVWSVAMGAHLLPGFNNPIALDNVMAGPGSRPFTMHLNADKPLVFFALLLAWRPLLISDRPLRLTPLLLSSALALALFLIAIAADALALEVGLPEWALLFALANLLMTCLTEEAFFRGFLQKALTARIGMTGGIVAASLLFGMVHFPGGPAVVVFATLLGAACGLGQWYGGRLRYAVWIHFGFNMLHLLFFTYPGPT
ncbi:CPBP family intramembrane glutamic endopeptidase [Tropicibacter sp. Alg240-R139]|uniref:CPBP family intramembrane glutamic endopeptidase n=1 Tax=Tropicibacter sp. Alg240-R139 TaxID=2305991 RepID=UPI0013E043C1|nr:CPBP family intramembrane glutamic endopeptidase [Tropicibacter sp. Alg240-R139]